MSPENGIYQVIITAVENAAEDTPLENSAAHPTAYSRIETDKAIRVGNCLSDFAPQGEVVKEFDGEIVIQILCKVADQENAADYMPALEICREMTIKIAEVLLENTSFIGCSLVFKRAFRGWSKVDGTVYATALLPVFLNPTGKYAN